MAKRPRKSEFKRRKKALPSSRSKIKKGQYEAYNGRSVGERKEVPKSGNDEATDDSSTKPPRSYVLPYDWPSAGGSSDEGEDDSKCSQDKERHLVTYRLYGRYLFELMQSLLDLINASVDSEDRIVSSGSSVYEQLGFSYANFLEQLKEDDSILWDYLDENVDDLLERGAIKYKLEKRLTMLIQRIRHNKVKDEDAFLKLEEILDSYVEDYPAIEDTIEDAKEVLNQIKNFVEGVIKFELPSLNDLVSKAPIYEWDDGNLEISLYGNYTVEVPEKPFSLTYGAKQIKMTTTFNEFSLCDDVELRVECNFSFLGKEYDYETGKMSIGSIVNVTFDKLKIGYTLDDKIKRGSYTTDYGGSNSTYKKFYMTQYESYTAADYEFSISGWEFDFDYLLDLGIFATFCVLIGPFIGLASLGILSVVEQGISSEIEDTLKTKFQGLEGNFHEMFGELFKNLDLPVSIYYTEPFKEGGEQYRIRYRLQSEQERYATKIFSEITQGNSNLPEEDVEEETPESDSEPEDFGDRMDKQVMEFVPDWNNPLSYDNGVDDGDSIGSILYSLNRDYHVSCPKYLASKSGMAAIKYVLDNSPLFESKRDTLIVSLVLDGFSSKEISEMTWEETNLLIRENKVSERTIKDLKAYSANKEQEGEIFSRLGLDDKLEMSSVILTGIYYFSRAKKIQSQFEELELRKGIDDLTHQKSNRSPQEPSDETFEPPECSYSDGSPLKRRYGSMFDPLWLGLSFNCYIPNRLYSFLVDIGYFIFETSASNPLDSSQSLNCVIQSPSHSPKVDFSGSDGDTPQLKLKGVPITVEWGGEQYARPIKYECSVKIPLKPVFLGNDCLKNLSEEALSELVEIIPCLRELGWNISDEDYLSALFQHFIFLEPQPSDIEILITNIEDLVTPFDGEDNLTETQRKELVHSILTIGYEELIPIPVLFDIFHPYSGRTIEEYKVNNGWLNIYETYDTPNLDFNIF